ncbi:MAG: mechanosensitive ion channel family protein [Candidatus Rokuibacteriota bacterium]
MAAKDLVVDLAVRYGFQVLGALVILVLGYILARWCGALVARWLGRHPVEPPVRDLLVRVVRLMVLLLAVVVALDKFGFQIAPLVAGIGVAGLGVGFAMQGVLSNVFAGLTIIFTKPFRVGEFIEVAGVHGAVSAVTLFSTTLTHPDRSRIVIPNRKIVGEILHDYGDTRQLQLVVTISHASDVATTLRMAEDITRANPRVLKDPAPVIGVVEVGELGVKIGVRPWVRVTDVGPASAELYQTLIERFRANRVGVPLRQHEVRLLDHAAR